MRTGPLSRGNNRSTPPQTRYRVRTSLSLCRPMLLLVLRDKGDSPTGGVCRFLASSRAEMCSSSTQTGRQPLSARCPALTPDQASRNRVPSLLTMDPDAVDFQEAWLNA